MHFSEECSNNESITKISKEEGISEQTLRNWRNKARRDGYAAPGTDVLPDYWSTQDKFFVVVETASMNETELAEYAVSAPRDTASLIK